MILFPITFRLPKLYFRDRLVEQAAQVKYFGFPCAEHSNEPPKTEIMCTSGFHDFLSFISIAQKETFHIPLCNHFNYIYKNTFLTPKSVHLLITKTDAHALSFFDHLAFRIYAL